MNRNPLQISLIFILVTLAALLSGCQLWSTPEWTVDQARTLELPAPRMSADSVILEIAFVHVTPAANQVDAALWHDVNAVPLPWQTQKKLAVNGIRCGLIAGQLPASLQQLIQADKNTLDLQDLNGNLGHDLQGRSQRLHSRAGRRGQIVLTKKILPTVHLVTRDGDYSSGETFHQAQCVLEIRTYPQGDGRVRVQLTPEIQHGHLRSQFVGHDGSWLINNDRETRSFDFLAMEVLMTPGESLVLSCTADVKGLGQHMFVDGKSDSDTQYLVLVRLVQTQFDDLFAPDKTAQPVTDRWE
ncbi:MAG: hypothetical protein VB857_01655 [Pirellulaceae bacterium]